MTVLNHLMQNLPANEIKSMLTSLLNHFKANHIEILEKIDSTGVLTPEDEAEIIKIAKEFIQGR